MPDESAQARAVKGEGANARLVEGAGAPRVLCAGIIVLDKKGSAKVPVKSASMTMRSREQERNIPL